jgi:signal peptidase I
MTEFYKAIGLYLKIFILSLFIPGIGHARLGEGKRGLLLYGIYVAGCLLFLGLLHTTFLGLVSMVVVASVFLLFCALDAGRLSCRCRLEDLRQFQRYGVLWISGHLVFVGILIFYFPLKLYIIPSISMTPTLQLGDYFVATKSMETVTRGNIIVFSSPMKPQVTYVKRVIGLGRETVEIKGGRVLIDGRVLDEPYLTSTIRNKKGGRFGPLSVSADKVFVLGDNRDNSYDSRNYGCIAINSIHGRPLYIISSKDKERNGQDIR